MALYNYKVLVIIQKTSHSVLVNHGKTLKTFFQDFPGITNKIQGLSRTFQDSKKNPGLSRTFPGCGNPGFSLLASRPLYEFESSAVQLFDCFFGFMLSLIQGVPAKQHVVHVHTVLYSFSRVRTRIGGIVSCCFADGCTGDTWSTNGYPVSTHVS